MKTTRTKRPGRCFSSSCEVTALVSGLIARFFTMPVLLLVLYVEQTVHAEPTAYRLAVLALVENAELRASFEKELVEKLRERQFDVITSFDIERDLHRVSKPAFTAKLKDAGAVGVIVLRPAAIGSGSSLESVRAEIPSAVYQHMEAFARQSSKVAEQDILAVVHLALYVFVEGQEFPVSSGAVWVDEPVSSREDGIEKLQALVVKNLDAARPGIRRSLGLPPLDSP